MNNAIRRQGKRIRRQEVRAGKEREIAYECGMEIQMRRDDAEIKANDMEKQIAEMEARIRRLAAADPNNREALELAGKVRRLRSELDFRLSIVDELDNIHELLNSLVDRIDACISLGWYKFVIKTIPEKKLPVLISSEKSSDLTEVSNLVMFILQKIEKKIIKDTSMKEVVDKRSATLVAEQREQHDKRISLQNAEQAAELARILGNDAVADIPVPIANAKDDEEENPNYNRA